MRVRVEQLRGREGKGGPGKGREARRENTVCNKHTVESLYQDTTK